MRAGKLRHRVTIEQADEIQDAYGAPVQTWSTFATLWAAVEPLRGREFFAAKEQQARVTTRIRVRYLRDITPKMRVLYGARTYLINAVIDPEERHAEMQLLCEELVAT